jgi:hypothetical protein
MSTAKIAKTSKGRAFIQELQGAIDIILHPPVHDEQRLTSIDPKDC